MDVWGSTLDVCEVYMDYLKDQLSNKEAYEKILEDFEDLMGDEDAELLFWFALAETQWKEGRMTQEVKEKALYWIEKDGGVNLWVESGANPEGWKKTLQKLKEKLNSPMRSEKKIKKPEVINQNLWNIGDVYAYQFHTEESKELGRYGKYVLLIGESPREYTWMIPEESASLPIMMIIHVFDKLFDNVPEMEEAKKLKLLPVSEVKDSKLLMSRLMELQKKSHYPVNHLTYLGNMAVTPNNLITPSANPTFWDLIEKGLNRCFTYYHDKEYEEIEEGIFRFKRFE